MVHIVWQPPKIRIDNTNIHQGKRWTCVDAIKADLSEKEYRELTLKGKTYGRVNSIHVCRDQLRKS
ncbi:MAG: hypothetical protein NVS2B14_18810 [Chamaesiphon sp.]